ncbi:MAG: molybdopterin-binding protein [Amylibacter sp.]|jgi:molybdenum cofactor synthesis domain-containing protein|nr:molybdopterin-binding protein [Amylibacter sp.]|tara:strand:+ start:6 stop:737 length:732 start_codon:yes stop_codon:yes gene_type:complete
MTNPTAAMIVIGDEILSGRTRDANMFNLAGKLTAHGINLLEVRVISDKSSEIITAVNETRIKYDHVFTSGGIGPTHDDITADCIAAAFKVKIDIRDDAKNILATNYENGINDLTPARLRMARIPDGANLIDNAISKAPGFSMENVHVMAGVPSVFNCMIDWLLPKLKKGAEMISLSIRIDLPESHIAEPLGKIANKFPAVSIGSYPFYEENKHGANIVIRSTETTLILDVEKEVRSAFKLPLC